MCTSSWIPRKEAKNSARMAACQEGTGYLPLHPKRDHSQARTRIETEEIGAPEQAVEGEEFQLLTLGFGELEDTQLS